MDEGNKDLSMLDVNDATTTTDGSFAHTAAKLTQSFSQMNVDEVDDDDLKLQPQPSHSHDGQARQKCNVNNDIDFGQNKKSKSRSTLIFDDDDEITPYSGHHENGVDEIYDSENENSSSISFSDSDDNSATNLDNKDSCIEDTNKNTLEKQQSYMEQKQQQKQQQEQQSHYNRDGQPKQSANKSSMIPVDIVWQQGGNKAYVTGSFTGWRKMIGLVPVPGKPGILHVKLQLPPGTHRFRFIVDNELRFSDYLPTATDQMGNFVNYLEVIAPPESSVVDTIQSGINTAQKQHEQQQLNNNNYRHVDATTQQQKRREKREQEEEEEKTHKHKVPISARSRIAMEIEQEPDDMGDGYTRYHDEKALKPEYEFTQAIPAVFTDPTVMEQYYLTLDQQQNNHQNMAWLTPPQLPPHLENVILNSYSNSQGENNENNSGALPIPNHVILNHLATSSIKHNTLCVASIVRYKQKYVTQILYAPLQ